MSTILEKLRQIDVDERLGSFGQQVRRDAKSEFLDSGVKFAGSHSRLEEAYYSGVRKLIESIFDSVDDTPILHEGGGYDGCWMESTGSISTELMSRFLPKVAQSSLEIFADHAREDGLMPYKLIPSGPSYRQIQMVTPFARCVWNHYAFNGKKDKKFLKKMYYAIAEHLEWLAKYRDTRGTGCVEAFCTFDTGNDASPRFWGVPDVPYQSDPAKYDPDSPVLPYLAPDLTANVYCQMKYLQRMAEELDIEDETWAKRAESMRESLMKYCYDDVDRYFYDRDINDQFIRTQSVTLLRTYASEAGSDEMFKDALKRYFLNTKKFFCRYPLTTMALDDPGYFQVSGYNSWSGQISFLSEIRIPHAFEYHRRYVELSWILQPIVTVLSTFKYFTGGTSAWVGKERESLTSYSPTSLCLMDFLERLSGIAPRPEGELWFTALIPYGIDYGYTVAEETGYSRRVDGALFEFTNEKSGISTVYKDGVKLYELPRAVRLVTDKNGKLKGLIGMSVRDIEGEIKHEGKVIPFKVSGNEILEYNGSGFQSVENLGVVPPTFEVIKD
jgi:hypothetical protein